MTDRAAAIAAMPGLPTPIDGTTTPRVSWRAFPDPAA